MPRELHTRRRPALRGLGSALALAALLAGCTPEPMPTPTPTPTRTVAPSGDGVLRIGTLLPTTGGSLAGAAQLAGVRAAVREINAAGGVDGTPVELVSRDSGDESTQAEAAFSALVERGVDVVIGPSSSTLVERLLPLAREAGVPLISPAASAPGLGADADGFFARTIPAVSLQGAVLGGLLTAAGASEVALIVGADPVAGSIAAPLEAALAEVEEGELTTTTITSAASAASEVRTVVRARPDAVVLATSDPEVTVAVLSALVDGRHAASKLWLTSLSLGDHAQTLPAGALEGARGIRDGVIADDAFLARLRIEEPALGAAPFAAEAYDATVIAALAAVLAGDDGGPSIAWRLGEVTRDGIPCTSFGACLDVLSTEPAIAYAGLTGALALDAFGSPTRAPYSLFRYDGENRPQYEGPLD